MKEYKKLIRVILIICIAATLCFIWGHSVQSRAESAGESNSLLKLLAALAGKVGIYIDTSDDYLLRKLAHLAEYAALGAEFLSLIINEGKFSGKWMMNCAGLGLICAVIDETIQIFSDRGSALGDVWLDLAGTMAGMGIVYAVRLCILRKHFRPNQ